MPMPVTEARCPSDPRPEDSRGSTRSFDEQGANENRLSTSLHLILAIVVVVCSRFRRSSAGDS